MTTSAAVFSDKPESIEAARQLAEQISKTFGLLTPSVIIVFASPVLDQVKLLTELKKICNPEILIGCSSAGEFISGRTGIDSVSAIALHSNEMQFAASVGRGIKFNRDTVVDQLLDSMQGHDHFEYKYHTAMLLADALSGYTDEIIEKLTLRTAGTYQFFGGGAGDNAQFKETSVFFDTEVIGDAVVMLEILSNKPIGLGVSHGWNAGSELFRVTEAEGARLVSLNSIPAVEVFASYAGHTKQEFDKLNPVPFFLHNIIGIKTDEGFKLRVPLIINADGSITCASDIPEGSLVSIMSTHIEGAKNAAQAATKTAISQLQGHKANIGFFFDCVATRLRLGNSFDLELEAVQDIFEATNYIGCNTHGQVARMNGQFSGFHNCSAVVCVIPE